MVRIPEYEKGRSVFPRRTATRKQAVVAQRKGSFKQYAEQYEKKDNRPSPRIRIDNSSFLQADPNTIYRISNSVEVNGYQFPEGVLPINAVPVGEIPFYLKLFLRLGLARRQK